MRSLGLPLLAVLLLLVIAITLNCGSPAPVIGVACNSAPSASNGNEPTSIDVCPAAADAKNYSGGLVQFVAIGDFSVGPSPAVVKPAIWGVCQNDLPTTEITVSTTGVAHCASGASGTYTVWATGGPDTCLVVQACGACGPTAAAQLSCP